ncbi:O-methyltransferase [Paenibacillus aestuarii]|uniref:O-methyltransferase n=1 Tax=Paenibacillus aestuarii TaxID=516965 RepID=A0ABW0KEZ2_9BACL|nr:O-methyltransferase [Paenibacillus aestuarii]
MTQNETWRKVDDYVVERLIPNDPVLEHVLSANRNSGLPEIDVSPAQGKLLHIWARMQGAKRILEIGTLGGYSTVWLARALPAEGKVVTLELDPHHAQVAQSNLALAGLDDKVEIRVGAALQQLALMKEENQAAFDLIFIDADKPNNPAYLQWALQFSHPGTVIIGDNVIREGKIVNEQSTDASVQGVRQFYDLIAEEPRLTATAIQTVGVKGYDGFIIAIVD